MERNKRLFLTRLLYVMFTIGTVISIFIVYSDLDSNIAYKFVMFYLLLTFFMLVYIPITVIRNSRKLKWSKIKKKIFKFVILFVIFAALNYGLDYLFRPSKIDLMRQFLRALALAFGISFTDVIFLKNKHY